MGARHKRRSGIRRALEGEVVREAYTSGSTGVCVCLSLYPVPCRREQSSGVGKIICSKTKVRVTFFDAFLLGRYYSRPEQSENEVKKFGVVFKHGIFIFAATFSLHTYRFAEVVQSVILVSGELP